MALECAKSTTAIVREAWENRSPIIEPPSQAMQVEEDNQLSAQKFMDNLPPNADLKVKDTIEIADQDLLQEIQRAKKRPTNAKTAGATPAASGRQSSAHRLTREESGGQQQQQSSAVA